LCSDVTGRFDIFAILAGMRTGSNLLEELLSAHPEISCHGELFNPQFVGAPGRDDALGISRRARDADPAVLLAAVAATPDRIAGFRIFDGHDERAIGSVLADPRCAKIVLSRNALDSYLSLKIARETGQWWLGDLGSARTGRVRFDAAEFDAFLEERAGFRRRVRRSLQMSGQTAFHLDYDDLRDPEVIAGLYAFLGCSPFQPPVRTRTKAQNPAPANEKVRNPRAMRTALSRIDPFDPDRTPDLEPGRGPGVRAFRVGADVPVMFMPVGHVARVEVDGWLTAVSGGDAPGTGLGQQALRAWMRARPGHRKIAVVEHPASRIHAAFSHLILPTDLPEYEEKRHILVRQYGVPLPDDPADPGYDAAAHRTAFLAFLAFVRGNLGGQTGLRPDAAWASQSALLSGICGFATPDTLIRKETLGTALARLSDDLGLMQARPVSAGDGAAPVALAEILDQAVREAVHAAYRRDFILLGYDPREGPV
jgi:hypothetical protein